MADDTAKSDFSVILKNLNRKFDITDCKWTEDCFFEIKFRTHIPVELEDYNTYCDNWADDFSKVTDTIWVHKISNTGPKVKFRKQYQCWTYEDREVKKELLFDACRCRGTMDIKILADSTSGAKKNRYLRLGLNAVIKISFHHLHPVDCTQNYSFFVHHCEPQPEPPRPVAQPSDRVSHLVARMVQQAAITSQKAAERAQEALKRQCIVPVNVIHDVEQVSLDVQVPQVTNYEQDNVNTISEKYDPSVAQVIVNTDGQTAETYYVQHLVFDSATQTITEVIPVGGDPGVSNLIEVQIPQTSHISQVVEAPRDVQIITCTETKIM